MTSSSNLLLTFTILRLPWGFHSEFAYGLHHQTCSWSVISGVVAMHTVYPHMLAPDGLTECGEGHYIHSISSSMYGGSSTTNATTHRSIFSISRVLNRSHRKIVLRSPLISTSRSASSTVCRISFMCRMFSVVCVRITCLIARSAASFFKHWFGLFIRTPLLHPRSSHGHTSYIATAADSCHLVLVQVLSSSNLSIYRTYIRLS